MVLRYRRTAGSAAHRPDEGRGHAGARADLVRKLNNVRTALRHRRQARTILGGNGVAMDYSPMRHANTSRRVRTYEGTDEIHILIIGPAIHRLPAFS